MTSFNTYFLSLLALTKIVNCDIVTTTSKPTTSETSQITLSEPCSHTIYPSLFDDISTEQGITIGWIQMFSCQEGYVKKPNIIEKIYPNSQSWTELLQFTDNAITAQIISRDTKPSEYDFTNNPNDPFAVMTRICSNPVWALNNRQELSYVINTTSLAGRAEANLDDWLGSNSAKRRLPQNTYCHDCVPQNRSLTDVVYHACCNTKGIHLNKDSCAWHYRNNLDSTQGIAFWIGFDIDKQKCCMIENENILYAKCKCTSEPATTELATSEPVISITTVPTTIPAITTAPTTSPTTTTPTITAPTTTTPITTGPTSTALTNTTPTTAPTITTPTAASPAATLTITAPTTSSSLSSTTSVSISDAETVNESAFATTTQSDPILYALLTVVILLLLCVVICFGFFWRNKQNNKHIKPNPNVIELEKHEASIRNDIDTADIEAGNEMNEGCVTENTVTNVRKVVIHSENCKVNEFTFEIRIDLNECDDTIYISLISSIKLNFDLSSDAPFRLYEKVNGSDIDIDDIMDLVDAFEANGEDTFTLNLYVEIGMNGISESDYCIDHDIITIPKFI